MAKTPKTPETSTDAANSEAPATPATPARGGVETAAAEPSIEIEDVIARTVGATMEKVLTQLLPAAMAAGINAARQSQLPELEKRRLEIEALKPPDGSKFSAGMNCPDCHQPTGPKGGAFACKGKHRMAVVAPKDEDLWEWFQAPTINGVHYNSGTNRQPICVPADCNVEGMVQEWEMREKSYLKRRSFNGNAARGGVIDYSQRQRMQN